MRAAAERAAAERAAVERAAAMRAAVEMVAAKRAAAMRAVVRLEQRSCWGRLEGGGARSEATLPCQRSIEPLQGKVRGQGDRIYL